MKRRLPHLAAVSLIVLFSASSYLPVAQTNAAEKTVPVTFTGAAKPFVNAQSGRTWSPKYVGDANAVAEMQSSAIPRAMITAEVYRDGAPDLIAGYKSASGGVIAISRGNPDAFAPKDSSFYAQARKGILPPEFLSKTTVISVPETPDFLATADVDHDGHLDILVGAQGGGLYYIAGAGDGTFSPAKRIGLPGDVTALAVNPAGDIAVGIESGGNTQILVFGSQSKNGIESPIASYALSAPATSLQWGRLSYNTTDLAVATGSNVTIYYDVLHDDSKSETIALPFRPQAIAVGEFTWNRDGELQVAALADDGTVHILHHGTLDTRPVTRAEAKTRRAAVAAQKKQQKNLDPTNRGSWSDARQIAVGSGSTAGVAPQSILRPSRFGAMGLLVHDGAARQMHVVNSLPATSVSSMSLSGTPVASVDLPVMINGRPSLAALTSAQSAPVIFSAPADPTFNVTTTTDEDDAGACTGTVTSGNGPDGFLSLREAICEANNLTGPAGATINVPAGTYVLSLSTGGETGELQAGNTNSGITIVIVGASAATTIIQQSDGKDRVIEQDPILTGSISLTLQNLTIKDGTCNATGVDCSYGGGGILGTGTTGDDLTLTNVILSNNSTSQSPGGAVNTSSDGNFTITNTTFSGNTNGYGSGGGFQFTPEANGGSLSITNSTFAGNAVTGTNAIGGAAVIYPNTGNSATITGSTFIQNTATDSGAVGGAIEANAGVTMSNSRIFQNLANSLASGFHESGGSGSSTVTNNWWGCNAGPLSSGCDQVQVTPGSTAVSDPWLVLAISATNTQILPTTGTSTINVDLAHNSASGTGHTIPDGVGVSLSAADGTLGLTGGTLASGLFNTSYTAGATPANDPVSATVDNQTVSVTIHILDTVTVGTSINGVDTNGLQFSVDSNPFTSTQTFNWIVGDLHTIATTSPQPPGSGGGQYDFTAWSDAGAISHSISAPASTTGSFVANFDLSPAITSGNGTIFVENTPGTFNVTATGNPAPTFSEIGATLPGTVALSTGGSLAGTPANGSAGFYPITITATNGAAPDAIQSFTLTVRSQGIDLIESAVSMTTASPVGGGSISVSDTAMDQGVNPAPWSRTTFYLSTDGVTPGISLAFHNVPVLASGATFSTSTSMTLPVGLLGNYYIIACADSQNVVAESHENNNCASSAVFSVGGADLVESAVTVPGSASGATITASDTVTNSGVGAAGPSRTTFYLSVDGTTQNRALGFRNVPVLASGATSSASTPLTLPQDTNGTFFIIACADSLNTVAETNESNNCTASSSSFTAGAPDLTETSVTAPATVGGATVAVTDTVADTGTSASSSRTTFYLSSDGVTQGASIGFRNVPGVPSGTSSTATTPVVLPPNLSGTFYIIACADSLNQVAESNESNNCSASNSFTVAGPDLTESAVSVTTSSPVSGGSISVSDTVADSGSAAGSSRTVFYFSTDGTTRGASLAFRNVGTVPGSGGTSSGSTNMTLPASINGTYFIIACADALNQVAESNESNNCSTSAGFSVTGADLVETGVSVPSSASTVPFQVSDTAQNNGLGAAGASRTTFYLSSDGVTLGRSLAFRNVPTLASGSSSTGSTTLTLPSNLSGTFYIIACADSLATVAETNETNNCSASGSFTAP